MSQQDMTRVPDRSHYSLKYMRGGRVFSYAHQINSVLGFEPETVLEVGPGPGMVTAALRAIGIRVTTADVQPDLKPDVVASVTELPFDDNSFDVSLCCQVLEHLPYQAFVIAVRELCRVSRKAVIISLPDVHKYHFAALRLPKTGVQRLIVNTPWHLLENVPVGKLERAGHHWEVGFRGYSYRRIRNDLKTAGAMSIRSWRVSELPWHRFYELRPSTESTDDGRVR